MKFTPPSVIIMVITVKCKKYLYASLDDEVSWQEWDFDNTDEFENSIVEYIANRVNRTIKTVIQKEKRKSFEEAVYYLDQDTSEWILIEKYKNDDKLTRLIAANKTENTETVKTYKLEI